MSTRVACPLCGAGSEHAFTVTDRNRAITDARFAYRRCTSCGTHFIEQVPEDLGRYYPEEYYPLPEAAQLDQAAALDAEKLTFITPFATAGRLVEIGAGWGLFAHAARRAGFDVTAIEMDSRCCRYLASTIGVCAINSGAPANELAGLESSRVIALWQAIEHLPDPHVVLRATADNLEPGGILVVATPNPTSLQFRLLQERWVHLDAPRHLHLIPASALIAHAAALGLQLKLLTTADAAGRECNRFGWECALRRHPASRAPHVISTTGSKLLERVLRPIEQRGLAGSIYTAVFVKASATATTER